jgi:DNA-binding phage protein
MREIRNALAHEYLDDINSDIELLNSLFETKGLELVQIFQAVLDYIKANMVSNLFEETQIEINRFYETLAKSDFSDSKG